MVRSTSAMDRLFRRCWLGWHAIRNCLPPRSIDRGVVRNDIARRAWRNSILVFTGIWIVPFMRETPFTALLMTRAQWVPSCDRLHGLPGL